MTSPHVAKRKLAIVGAGSAGLISLYYALRRLPDWQITCYEKSDNVQGAWGNPYRGFVSTSTKYTTQFSCHRRFDAFADAEGEAQRGDFFKDGEYGAYLEEFARLRELKPHIRHHHTVQRIQRVGSDWRLTIRRSAVPQDTEEQKVDALILCTGLAEQPKKIDCGIDQLIALDDIKPVTHKTIVVVGGGESAVDMANRLSKVSLHNKVFLSLKTGIRVSPRYHPIKGVPSDFLRTRLMLSIHESIRNAVGQKFVEARIRHQELFERVFRRRKRHEHEALSVRQQRKYWAAKLTERAKATLFNMFHNKSDDFLDAVAEDRLKILGPPLDATYRTYADFDDGQPVHLDPDLLIPMIGFSSNVQSISDGAVTPRDFYLGCVHTDYDNLFLVGFARPVIGNIPSISEMQAQYVIGLLGGRYPRPSAIQRAHGQDRARLEKTFHTLDTNNMYPVEMFPYCDRLAKRMHLYPTLQRTGSLRSWLKIWLSPASTMQYLDESYDAAFMARQPIHSPLIINVLLLIIKLLDLVCSPFRRAEERR